jgi:beta-lactamase superfamily II metal-dependent hydrolase
MFYINHGSDNFTIIDCCLSGETDESILNEIATLSAKKGIARFISTHPDDDHIRGLELLDEKVNIMNFYCVKNGTTKSDETDSFTKYIELHGHDTKAFHIFAGCSRKWMNLEGDGRGQSGINVLWPKLDSQNHAAALAVAAEGGSPNNISAIIQYSLTGGATVLWMGDLETDFMESIKDELNLPTVDILFAPHHGRDSGKIPESMLKKMSPKIIIVGEAPSEHLHYYPGYNTITQNSAGDIVFECQAGKVHIFTSNEYQVDFLVDESWSLAGHHYVGTLNLA